MMIIKQWTCKKLFTLDWLKNFFSMVSILLIATLLAAIDHQFQRVNIVSIYLLSIVIIARITNGYFWGILSAFFAVLCVNYLFTYPYFSFDFTLNGYPVTFFIMGVTALIVNITTAKLKIHAKIAKNREKETQELYLIIQDFVSINSKEKAIEIILSHLRDYLKTDVQFHSDFSNHTMQGIHEHWYYKPIATARNYYGTLVIDISKLAISITNFKPFLELAVSRTVTLLEHLELQEIQHQTL